MVKREKNEIIVTSSLSADGGGIGLLIVSHRSEKLDQAITHHRAGQTAQAEVLYREILATDETDADANHYLGLIAHQFGQFEAAVELISKALASRPNDTQALLNLANAHSSLGRKEEAVGSLRTALKINPAFAEGYANLGIIQKEMGNISDAISSYRKAIKVKPGFLAAHFNFANLLKAERRFEEAIEQYGEALKLNPVFVEGHINLGSVYEAVERFDKARACYHSALAINPNSAGARCNLAALDLMDGDNASAYENAKKAVQINPDFGEAYRVLGMAQRGMKQYDAAELSLYNSIEMDPDNYINYNTLALILKDKNEITKSLDYFKKALEIKPDFADAHGNIANLFKDLDQLSEATAHYQTALKLNPKSADAHSNYGSLLKDQGELDSAVVSYQTAVALKPDFADALYNLGLIQLLRGDFIPGWKNYRWRWKLQDMSQKVRAYATPVWDGRPFLEKTLFVYPEQGLGDFVQFVRYLPLLKALGGKIILEIPKPLAGLYGALSDTGCFITTGQTPGLFDFHTPLLDLPMLLATDQRSIPPVADLAPTPPKTEAKWKTRLSPYTGLRIGIVWAGNPDHKNDKKRSISAEHFVPLTELDNVTVFSLQVGAGTKSKSKLIGPWIDLDADLTSFEETAAAMRQLDLVISVDSSPAHLAGTLGISVWTLLPFLPDWRWMMDRKDSPWYPTMRLFRQPRPGDWTSVMKDVCTALQDFSNV